MGRQLLAYADDINIVGEKVDTKRKNTVALIYASKEADLAVNPEKTKYTLMSGNQKVGPHHSMKTANRSFKDLTKSK
jgi:hypothetical protein